MATDVEIAQRALSLIGAKQIQSFDEDNDRAQICKNSYEVVKEYALSLTHWNFATDKARLPQIQDEPQTRWDYQYELPNDMIAGPIKVYNHEDTSQTTTGWEKVNNKLMSNYDTIYIDYIKNVSAQRFPPYFVRYIVNALAADIAKPITDQTSTAQFYEDKAQKFKQQAMVVDSQNQSSKGDFDTPFTDRRFDH